MSRSLVSIAVLEALFQETGKGTLDLLVPFAVHLAHDDRLADLGPDGLSTLCKAFEKTYGIRVPYHVMTTVIQRAKRADMVTLSADGTRYCVDPAKVASLGFDEKVAANNARWDTLIAGMREFCAARGCALSEAQAETGFLGFLKAHDADILLATSSESVLPRFTFTEEHVFLANAYVSSLNGDGTSPNLDFVVELALGHALASTIMNWNMPDLVGHMKGLYVYIDTPLLLQLMGLSVEPRVEAAREFVQVLQTRGALLFVFEHVIEEAIDLVNGAKSWIGNSAFKPQFAGQTALFIVDNGWSVLQVEKCIAGLDTLIEEIDIHRVAAPAPMALKDHQINEQNLTDRIVQEYKSRVRDFRYEDRKWTIQRDVMSIAAIHKLRKGRRSAQLGSARHVFVTANVGLALASRHFEEAEGDFAPRTIPACITDTLAATIAWIEAPDLGRPMSTRRVIAQALAAVQPSQVMLARLYSELASRRDAGTIDAAEYRALVADPLAREMLAQTTRNDPTRYNAQTTQEIIEEYRLRYERQSAEDLEAERTSHESTQKKLGSYRSRSEAVARRISLGVGLLVGLVGVGVVIMSAWLSQVAWTVVGALLGVLGGSVLHLSAKASGWFYGAVLTALTPNDSVRDD